MAQKVYKMQNGRKLQWLTCADCGLDLGPAAAQFRMRRTFRYPCAYRGKDERTLCGECMRRDFGLPSMAAYMEGIREDNHLSRL